MHAFGVYHKVGVNIEQVSLIYDLTLHPKMVLLSMYFEQYFIMFSL